MNKNILEYYLWHGNYGRTISSMCSEKGLGLNFRTSILSGCGGLMFSENSSQANLYVPCPTCGHGAMDNSKYPCDCSNDPPLVYQMLLCRVLLGNVHIQYDWQGDSIPNSVIEKHDSILCAPSEPGKRPRQVLLHNHALVYPEFLITFERQDTTYVPSDATTKKKKKLDYSESEAEGYYHFDNSLPVGLQDEYDDELSEKFLLQTLGEDTESYKGKGKEVDTVTKHSSKQKSNYTLYQNSTQQDSEIESIVDLESDSVKQTKKKTSGIDLAKVKDQETGFLPDGASSARSGEIPDVIDTKSKKKPKKTILTASIKRNRSGSASVMKKTVDVTKPGEEIRKSSLRRSGSVGSFSLGGKK